MKLFDDTVILEMQQEEWNNEKRKSKIITPESVQEKQDGQYKEKIPWHFFKVVAVGPNCKKVSVGDRVFPKSPNLHCQPQLIPLKLWVDGKETILFEIREEDIGGVE